MTDQSTAVGRLLHDWGQGDLDARDDFLPLVYAELRRRAAAYMRGERTNHTLQPTALVHEVYLRLVRQDRVAWHNRAHFFAVAAQMMRRILVDHARGRKRAKRPVGAVRVVFDDRVGATEPRSLTLLALDQALTDLTALDARLGRIVELRYFGGLSEREVGEVLSISRATVTREWQTARTWLYRRMTVGTERNGQ